MHGIPLETSVVKKTSISQNAKNIVKEKQKTLTDYFKIGIYIRY